MSFTATGLLVTFSGGSFGGEIRSRMFCHRLGDSFQLMSRSLLTLPRGAGRKNSFKFSETVEPNPVMANTGAPPRTFTGRSVRKSLRFDARLLRFDSCEGDLKRPNWRVESVSAGRVASSTLAVVSDIRLGVPHGGVRLQYH